MSSENVEIVRRAFAAFAERDLDAMTAICAEDILFVPVTARLAETDGGYRGHDGLRRYLDDVALVWQELRLSPDVFREAEDGLVVVTGRAYAWGLGRVVDSPAGWLWRVADGRIVYGRTFATASGALEAAGLGPG